MCCSESEIGISDDNSGIMEITDDLPNGTDIKEAYQVDDIIFEVDNKSLTNRPDLWGHYGIAREFAALAGRELKPLETVDLTQYNNLPKVDMKIEDPLCQRYSCLQVANHKCIFIYISFNTVKSLESERSIKTFNSNLFNLARIKCVHRLTQEILIKLFATVGNSVLSVSFTL